VYLPRSPAASQSLGPSVTHGMGAKVADSRVAILNSVSSSVSVALLSSWKSEAGARGGVGGGFRAWGLDPRPFVTVVTSGGRASITDTVLFPASGWGGRVTRTGGGAMLLDVVWWGARGFSGKVAGAALTKLGVAGVTVDVVGVVVVVVVVVCFLFLFVVNGVVVAVDVDFGVLGYGVEVFPGAGGGAVFK